ncbi:MAG TPA: hypothetical protein ENG13_04575 [bacterium]|nr:hypothetical protein [bacterium]HEX68320.1 hypothetical protein [bacterium]
MRIYRIKEWWYYLGFVLLGALAGKTSLKDFLISALSAFFIGCFSFSFNEFADKNLPFQFLKYPLITLGLALITLFFLPPLKKFLVTFLLILGFFYSFPLFPLKKIPFLGTLINGVGFPLLILLGSGRKEVLYLCLTFFFLCLTAQLIHEYTHQSEDEERGIISTAVKLGEKGKNFLFLLLLPPLYFSFYISFISPAFVFLMFLTLFNFRRKDFIFLRRIYRMENFIFGIYLLQYYMICSFKRM